jgi:hypothetical protein
MIGPFYFIRCARLKLRFAIAAAARIVKSERAAKLAKLESEGFAASHKKPDKITGFLSNPSAMQGEYVGVSDVVRVLFVL